MKKILITGVSSGFGLIALKELLEQGHTVIAGLRGGSERIERILETDPKSTASLSSGKLIPIDFHLEAPESIQRLADAVQVKFGGKLDVLINNAGFGLMGPVEIHSTQELRHQFEVNFFGLVHLSQILLPALKASRGRIINVSSLVGQISLPYYGSYAASKHALEAYTESLCYEMKPFGVQVALVEPGGFKTDFTRKMIFGARAKDSSNPYREDIEAFENTIIQKSAFSGNPQRVADLLIRLAHTPKIRLRYPVGVDARLVLFLKWLLPDEVRIRLINFVFKRIFLRRRS